MNLIETARNIFAIPDLRKRLMYTFALLAVYRLGSHIPTPGVDPVALSEFFKAMSGGVFGFLDLFSGTKTTSPSWRMTLSLIRPFGPTTGGMDPGSGVGAAPRPGL